MAVDLDQAVCPQGSTIRIALRFSWANMSQKIICVVNDVCLPGSGLYEEHGLSFWIDIGHGIAMLDTGQSDRVLTHNLKVLGLHEQEVNALVLSHAHYDHTGGLNTVLSGNPHLTIHAHADIFQPRFSYKNGAYQSIGLKIQPEELSSRARLLLSDKPIEVLPHLWTTGEIIGRSGPEGRSSTHFIHLGSDWHSDPYKDDMSLVWDLDDRLILICGCCHAGLLNTLTHVERIFNKPVHAILGGTHLISADKPQLAQVIAVLEKTPARMRFHLNHCTGETALQALKSVFGERVVAFLGGTVLHLDGLFA